MAACIDTMHRWNERYAIADYLYGEAPNAFLRANAHRLMPRQTALCVADGEGRNSVWLAESGLTVTAFDFAETAVAKGRDLAARRAVTVDYRVSDIFDWSWASNQFDIVVAIFIQFLDTGDREAVFDDMMNTLKPGGLLLLEGYRPEELAYGTGGELDESRLYTRVWLEQRFFGWDILDLNEYDAELHEGAAHIGLSALIDLVARKPANQRNAA
ncbi:MAG: class I SAM-dependent methyltransferase [Betaproteobacteria bacterium]